jgi:dTDP-glucose pyrophosphorylase
VNTLTKHLIPEGSTIKEALAKLNVLGRDAILFIVTDKGILKGSLTDGDVRRGLLNGYTIEGRVDDIIQTHPHYIRQGDNDFAKILDYRKQDFRIVPILDSENKIVNLINFREVKSYLPVDAMIMAGGRGLRLSPLTDSTPKPLLKIGSKPIIEHMIDRMVLFGIHNFWISVNYLGHQIESWGGDGTNKNISIKYVYENEPLGTIGSVSTISDFKQNYLLLANSDILTNIDYEHFFLDFIKEDADLSVVTIPYSVNIPYAVLNTNNGHVLDLHEKPTYTYYSNGGIYLMKHSILGYLPQSKFFNATDLIKTLLDSGKRVTSYPLTSYWLDIGKPEDYTKAQKDIELINL